MESSEQRSNPYSGDQQAERNAWFVGYEAAYYNAKLVADFDGFMHDCEDCGHKVKQSYIVQVAFEIEDEPAELPQSSKMIVEQLKDGLPQEWFVGANMATWGVIEIHPVSKHGVTIK